MRIDNLYIDMTLPNIINNVPKSPRKKTCMQGQHFTAKRHPTALAVLKRYTTRKDKHIHLHSSSLPFRLLLLLLLVESATPPQTCDSPARTFLELAVDEPDAVRPERYSLLSRQ